MLRVAEQNSIETACDRLMDLFEQALAIEERQCAKADDTIREPLLRYLIALMRMRVQPALSPGWPEQDAVHITLFGGTNSGKSTVVNICLGRAATGMHATARFSQHPEAYRVAALGNNWLEAYPSRFSGYQRYYDAHPPRQSDHDLAMHGYRPALAVIDPTQIFVTPVTLPATTSVIFWDAPDFSTEMAQAYFSAVLDVAALGDVVLMTVTDESYADDRGCALLRLISAAGVQVHIVANKLSDNRELLNDMKTRMDDNWRGVPPGLPDDQWHHLPRVTGNTPEQRLSNLVVKPEAITLRDAMVRAGEQGTLLKRQVLTGTMAFLAHRFEDALQGLAAEVEVAGAWEQAVARIIRRECLEPYRNTYLQGQRYSEFNQVLVRVMALLEVPGIGPVIKRLSDVVRLPLQTVTGWLKRGWRSVGDPRPPSHPEAEVLKNLCQRSLAGLKSEAQILVDTTAHPAWIEVVSGLDSHAWSMQWNKDFEAAYESYRQAIETAVQQRATEIYRMIAERPRLLNILRGTNLALDAATVVLVVQSGGLNWSDAVVGPIIASLRRALMEAGLDTYLVKQAEILKQQQYEAVCSLVATHLEQPVGRLFPGRLRRTDLDMARHDFAVLDAAIQQVIQQEKV